MRLKIQAQDISIHVKNEGKWRADFEQFNIENSSMYAFVAKARAIPVNQKNRILQPFQDSSVGDQIKNNTNYILKMT